MMSAQDDNKNMDIPLEEKEASSTETTPTNLSFREASEKAEKAKQLQELSDSFNVILEGHGGIKRAKSVHRMAVTELIRRQEGQEPVDSRTKLSDVEWKSGRLADMVAASEEEITSKKGTVSWAASKISSKVNFINDNVYRGEILSDIKSKTMKGTNAIKAASKGFVRRRSASIGFGDDKPSMSERIILSGTASSVDVLSEKGSCGSPTLVSLKDDEVPKANGKKKFFNRRKSSSFSISGGPLDASIRDKGSAFLRNVKRYGNSLTPTRSTTYNEETDWSSGESSDEVACAKPKKIRSCSTDMSTNAFSPNISGVNEEPTSNSPSVHSKRQSFARRESRSMIIGEKGPFSLKSKGGALFGRIKKIALAAPPSLRSPKGEEKCETGSPKTDIAMDGIDANKGKSLRRKKSRSLSIDMFIGGLSNSNTDDSPEISPSGRGEHGLLTKFKKSIAKKGFRPIGGPVIKSELSPISALERNSLHLDDCLKEPIMTRIFIEHLKIKDSFKLLFLFSVDEFQTLLNGEPVPPLPIQVTYAINIIKKYMSEGSSFEIIGTVDRESGEDMLELISTISSSDAKALPKNLFLAVRETVYDDLSRIFEIFRQTDSYLEMIQKHEKLKNMLTLEQVLDDEWNCLVLWAYLYREESCHNHIGFLMEMKFSASSLMQELNIEYPLSIRKLSDYFIRLAKKYLQSNSPLVIQVTTKNDFTDKKKAICDEIDLWCSEKATIDTLQDVYEKLNALEQCVILDMKRIHAPTFQQFLNSSMYQSHIVDTDTSLSTLQTTLKLMRECKVRSHRPAKVVEDKYTLGNLLVCNDDTAVCDVLTFELKMEEGLNMEISHVYENKNGAQKEIIRQLQPFLCPEAGSITDMVIGEEQAPKLFLVMVGNDQNRFYGAVYRTYECDDNEPNQYFPKGFVMLSRYPILQDLRHKMTAMCPKGNLMSKQLLFTDTLGEVLRQSPTFSKMPDHYLNFPPVDCAFEDLFESLSIENVLLLFSAALQEQKIIFHSSNYTTLAHVCESLKALLFPLEWSHVYMPTLPNSMSDYLQCPTPFIFGVHSTTVNQSMQFITKDIVLVDLDSNSIRCSESSILPPQVQSIMHSKLFQAIHPRLANRDAVNRNGGNGSFPTSHVRLIFGAFMSNVLNLLELRTSRIVLDESTTLSLIDSLNFHDWSPGSERLTDALLQSQSVSNYLGKQDQQPLLSLQKTKH